MSRCIYAYAPGGLVGFLVGCAEGAAVAAGGAGPGAGPGPGPGAGAGAGPASPSGGGMEHTCSCDTRAFAAGSDGAAAYKKAVVVTVIEI